MSVIICTAHYIDQCVNMDGWLTISIHFFYEMVYWCISTNPRQMPDVLNNIYEIVWKVILKLRLILINNETVDYKRSKEYQQNPEVSLTHLFLLLVIETLSYGMRWVEENINTGSVHRDVGRKMRNFIVWQRNQFSNANI